MKGAFWEADRTVVSAVMYSPFCTAHSNERCDPVICCRIAGHFLLPLRCRMGAALALTWTLGQFFFLCSFSQPTLTVYWTGIFFAPRDGKWNWLLWEGREQVFIIIRWIYKGLVGSALSLYFFSSLQVIEPLASYWMDQHITPRY